MPDTPANQAAYPQVYNQEPGLGFPLARIAVLLSLATGACHDLVVAPYAGKGTGETTLLREMYGSLRPGDVVLADAVFDNYFLASELRAAGVDLVARRKYDRAGSRVVRRGPDGVVLVLAAAAEAPRDDRRAVPHLSEDAAHAAGRRRRPGREQPGRPVRGHHHDPRTRP